MRAKSLPSPDARDFALTLIHKATQDELIITRLLKDPKVADEVLGFHLQQAVEKRLKAVLALNDVPFRRTHNIAYLTTLLEQNDVDLPACREEIEMLSPWAGDARYDYSFEGVLDRPTVLGLLASVASWSDSLVGATGWLSATARLLQRFAEEGAYDHVALLVERERESFVIHVTVDRSVWIGRTDELAVLAIVNAFDHTDREVTSVASPADAITIADGLTMVVQDTLKWLAAKQAQLLVRSEEDFSFMWWHATAERTITGDDPSDSLSGVLLDIDQIAARPTASGEFEKPDPDVRFSAGTVHVMTDEVREAIEQQLESFRKKFGREPEPDEPIFFDPEADQPELMPREKFDRIIAMAEEFGATEYSKRMAAAKVRAGMVERADSEEAVPYDEVNPIPMLLVLAETAEAEGDLQARCLYAAVHAWAEGHLAVPTHPQPADTGTPLHVPPFPHPQEDGERLATIAAVAREHVHDGGSEIAAMTLAAGLAWEAGWRQGLECDGCAVEGGDSPFSRAMRNGQIRIGFSPIVRTPNLDTTH